MSKIKTAASELARLIKALGGTPGKNKTTASRLHTLADMAENGEIGGGGGSKPLIVTLAPNGQGGYETDYTVEEIASHYNNGETVQIFYERTVTQQGAEAHMATRCNVTGISTAIMNDTLYVLNIYAQAIDYTTGEGWTVHA